MELSKFALFSMVFLVTISMVSGVNWLEEPAWNDVPTYAEDMKISVEPTDLIEVRESREVCSSYSNNILDNGSTVRSCDSYITEFYGGDSKGVFDFTGKDAVYLGDGYVRANVTVGLNSLTEKTLKEALYLMGESTYLDWFNDNYAYQSEDMTSSDLSSLQDSVQDLSANGENTGIVDSRINSIDLVSGTSEMTFVFRFNDYRNGVINISDLFNVEVVS